jgi:hypothetical protein
MAVKQEHLDQLALLHATQVMTQQVQVGHYLNFRYVQRVFVPLGVFALKKEM